MSQAHTAEAIRALAHNQKADMANNPAPDAADRRARIQQVIDLLVEYKQPLVDAMGTDFGVRHPGYSIMNDILGSLASLKHTRDSLENWLGPESRPPGSPADQLGAKAWVRYQPKGSIGIIGTWNAPLFTVLSPLACVLGAGNRAVIKPSEVVPETAKVLEDAVTERIDPKIIAAVTGDADVGAAMSSTPFDHLVFTGSAQVGRRIMAAAAENLTPVTLELGGKSPTIISRSADLPTAAYRLAMAKSTNGGQICVSPDLLYVPADQFEETIGAIKKSFANFYPTVKDNPDLVSMVNDQHMARVDSYVDEVRQAGGRVEITPDDNGPYGDDRQRPLQLVVDPPADTRILQEEIFGPAIVVLPYDDIQEVIDRTNSGGHPLALYYFGSDEAELKRVLDGTLSGGVTVNDALAHGGVSDAPFGGVGASGMGHYHGFDGFREFSHMRTVFEAADYDPRADYGLLPPYGENFQATMESMVTRD